MFFFSLTWNFLADLQEIKRLTRTEHKKTTNTNQEHILCNRMVCLKLCIVAAAKAPCYIHPVSYYLVSIQEKYHITPTGCHLVCQTITNFIHQVYKISNLLQESMYQDQNIMDFPVCKLMLPPGGDIVVDIN